MLSSFFARTAPELLPRRPVGEEHMEGLLGPGGFLILVLQKFPPPPKLPNLAKFDRNLTEIFFRDKHMKYAFSKKIRSKQILV
jgi:hypothetical protein